MDEVIFWKAVKKGDLEVVKRGIQSQFFSVNSLDSLRWSPLVWSAYNGDYEMVKYLVEEEGAEINLDNKSLGPIHAASNHGHTKVVELLVLNGADINSQNTIGWTPLHYAFQHRHFHLVGFLLLSGADPQLSDIMNLPAINQNDPVDSLVAHFFIRLLDNVCQLEHQRADCSSLFSWLPFHLLSPLSSLVFLTKVDSGLDKK